MRRNRHIFRRPRNPLVLVLIALLIVTLILAIALIITGSKYGKAKKEMTGLKKQVTAYEQAEKEREEAEEKAEKEQKKAEEQAMKNVEKWLDLKGHDEFSVKPTAFYDKYYSYKTTDKLRLRAGPGTNYDNIVTIPENTEVKAAAKDADWTFVRYGEKFGWVKTEYLKLNGETPKLAAEAAKTEEKTDDKAKETEEEPEEEIYINVHDGAEEPVIKN